MLRRVSILLLASISVAHPTPAGDTPPAQVTALTSFKFKGCDNSTRRNILDQNAKDAATLAYSGIKLVYDELSVDLTATNYTAWLKQTVDFSEQAAIDFFGPPQQNAYVQARIVDTLLKASDAYPGWGLSDWWNNRYVMLSCIDHKGDCKTGKYAAYFDPGKRDEKYPVVVFCDEFFSKLPSHSEAVSKMDKNKDLQQNVANLRSRATTFLHELLHINWGTAQECTGENACRDHLQMIGGESVRTYKTGRAKLLAQRNVESAARNNDNYAYFSMAKFMQERYKQYPQYPSVWDPDKSRADNEDREKSQPGAPPGSLEAFEDERVTEYNETLDGPIINDPIYQYWWYPEWYQPLINTTFDDPTPELTSPAPPVLTYNGPDIDDVTCETSDRLPIVDDCVSAIGSLKRFPDASAQPGEKGRTWWAGYYHSCAVAIHYRENWNDNCKATLKDVGDHAWAIFEKCQNPSNDKVGGKVDLVTKNCKAQIEILKTSGLPPNGSPP